MKINNRERGEIFRCFFKKTIILKCQNWMKRKFYQFREIEKLFKLGAKTNSPAEIYFYFSQ